jgi:trans-2,3-dihydro-3-hydroxyanthranilate isomerase
MTLRFETIDVFTDRRFGGNPLAVVFGAEALDAATMQAIAAEFGYSETTFVLPPADAAHTARVRIFMPAQEVPFAGHPNVGTGFVIAARGEIFSQIVGDRLIFEEDAGLVEVEVLRDGGRVAGARIAAPKPLATGATVDTATVAACLGLPEADIVTSAHRPIVASVGLGFVMVELAGPAALGRIEPDPAAFRYLPEDAHDIHVYARTPDEPDLDLRARMFAPLEGVPEDPATGSANAALGALLASLAPSGRVSLRIGQGDEMGRPSRLLVEAGPGRATVAGPCVRFAEGTLAFG